MNHPQINVRISGSIPKYQTLLASGSDLCAVTDEPIIVNPLKRCIVHTNVKIEIPPGYEAQIRPRSGLAAKFGITVLNTPGTIDADYRGEIMVILINLGDQAYTVRNGDRIAQMVICPVVQCNFVEADLTFTERGADGFGSTGK